MFISAAFRVVWPIILFWVYEVPTSLPKEWQGWIQMNSNPLFMGAAIGSAIWIVLMLISEYEPAKSAYRKYVRPLVKFSMTEHSEGVQLEIRENKHVLIGITIFFEGYFENTGGVASTIRAIETQFVRKYGILKIPIGRINKAAYFVEGEHGIVDSYRGFYVNEYSVSAKVKVDSTCCCKGECNINKLRKNTYIRIRWRVLGQELRNIEFLPDWDAIEKVAKYRLSQPIPL